MSELIKVFFVVFLFFSFVSGAILGNIDYNFEVDKCSNLKPSTSGYDFNYDVQLNADYEQDCYFINEHPLAYILYVIGLGLLMMLIGGFLWFMGFMILDSWY